MESKNQLTVLYIITQLELGGAQKVCLNLFDNVADKNIRTLLIAGPHGPLATDTLKHNPNVYLLSALLQTKNHEGILHEIRCFIKLTRLIRTLKKKYSHMIVHTHSSKAGILGRWAALCAGVPIRIHTVHGYALHAHSSWLAWLFIYPCELFTRFITTHTIYVSHHDQHNGQRMFFIPARTTSLIRAAIDSKPFLAAQRINPTLQPHMLFVFGTVSCFKPQKNLFDLLNAFNTVFQQDSRCRLEIIGDGTLRPQIKKWIDQHNLTTVITLHGWQQNVIPIMQNWHAFVLTSLWEGLPCAVVEARLLNLPVISYATGGVPDVITHNKNGFIVPQGDMATFSQYMLSLMHNRTLHQALSTYQDALHEFDLAHMVNKHKQLYTKLYQ